MLVKPDGEGALCIGQTSHSWISGQMARAWAEPFEYREEVCLAAELHDIGMAGWDLAPTLNPDTGLPHAFTEMPFAVHSSLWLEAPRSLVTTSTRAAALVSLHGTRLYELRDPTAEIQDYLDRQEEFRGSLGFARDDLEPASTLLWIWDFLSLAALLGWTGEVEGLRVDGARVEPWPFRPESLAVRCEGRRLRGRYDDENAMRAALAAAPAEPVVVRLEPGAP